MHISSTPTVFWTYMPPFLIKIISNYLQLTRNLYIGTIAPSWNVLFGFIKSQFTLSNTYFPTESQSNYSDSGVSETTSSGHVRSQSVVSSIFSEAWKRGNQAEESKVRYNNSTSAIIYSCLSSNVSHSVAVL